MGLQVVGTKQIPTKRNEWLDSECVNIFDSKIYQLALEQTANLDKAIARTYALVLYLIYEVSRLRQALWSFFCRFGVDERVSVGPVWAGMKG